MNVLLILIPSATFARGLVISLVFLYLKLKYQIDLFDKNSSLIQSISGLVQTLPGFYIAALAAIATFPSTSMNNPMPEPTPYLKFPNNDPDLLNRRRFLCYMFAYLAYISIVALFITSIAIFMYGNDLLKVPSILYFFAYFFVCLVIYFLLIQIALLTFVGLWYLGERIHLNDPQDIEDK
ncbi:hypothetical protein [Psychrobacter sp. AntiMn-1]|uniref:hypothetical protein n=1 Tax=Psychrobacter sp. AntiMn-1 TaxID=1720344 RepID=UPI0008D98D3E|nr:hypothetical protein [Psychrobacter sp. AntiMn-1]